MRRSAGKGTDRGRRRLRPRHLPGTDGDRRASVPVIASAPMPSTDAMERRRREPPFSPVSKPAALQPTPSPNRSPDPARQPALAPGLSLVPHGCGDPLIRLVQEPQLNRVLEGWCISCTRQKPPRAFERPGARAGCRAGPGDRSSESTAGFKGAGVSKEGPRSFVRPLFGRSTAKRSNEGVAGGLRPPSSAEGGAAFGRRGGGTAFGRPIEVQGPLAPAGWGAGAEGPCQGGSPAAIRPSGPSITRFLAARSRVRRPRAASPPRSSPPRACVPRPPRARAPFPRASGRRCSCPRRSRVPRPRSASRT
jgi:hypothetical protein